MTDDHKEVNDPELYVRMCVPHKNKEIAEAAMDSFLGDVSAARERHKISDVLVACEARYLQEDGEETSMVISGHRGASVHAARLAAYAWKSARDRITGWLAHLEDIVDGGE